MPTPSGESQRASQCLGVCVKGLRSISEAFLEEGLPSPQERGKCGRGSRFSRHWMGKQ